MRFLKLHSSCSIMKVFSTPVVFFGLLVTSYSYTLDKSCSSGSPYEDLVTKGLENAFDFAQAASDITKNLRSKSSGDVWKAQSDLVSYLFHKAMTLSRPDPENANWKTIGKVFKQVLAFNTNKQPNLVIFCDMNRFTLGENRKGEKDPSKAWDKKNDMQVNFDEDFKSCQGDGDGVVVGN